LAQSKAHASCEFRSSDVERLREYSVRDLFATSQQRGYLTACAETLKQLEVSFAPVTYASRKDSVREGAGLALYGARVNLQGVLIV